MDGQLDKKIAEEIFLEIKKSKNILLALHVSPDEDCLGSVLAMDMVLRKMGKKTRIISFSQINDNLYYFHKFPSFKKIDIVDFATVDFSEYDLFLALDSAQERMITRSVFPKIPKSLRSINIDHHITNTRFAQVNFVEPLSSTSELIFYLFKLWKIEINKIIARLLLAGIVADSGCFRYPLTTSSTLQAASKLIDKGGSLKEIILAIFLSNRFKTLKYWGKILGNMQLDCSEAFIWSTISQDEKDELGLVPSEIEGAASMFAPIVKDTKFGIILIEENPGLIRGTMRGRGNFDVSKIAVELGGGGHKQAAGFSLNLSLEEAEKKVLQTARKNLKIKK